MLSADIARIAPNARDKRPVILIEPGSNKRVQSALHSVDGRTVTVREIGEGAKRRAGLNRHDAVHFPAANRILNDGVGLGEFRQVEHLVSHKNVWTVDVCIALIEERPSLVRGGLLVDTARRIVEFDVAHGVGVGVRSLEAGHIAQARPEEHL